MTSAHPSEIDAPVAIDDERPVGAVLVIALGSLSGFAPLSIDMYLPGLPALQRQFHVLAVFATNAAGILLASQVSQHLVARVGPERLFVAGITLSLVGATVLVCGVLGGVGLLGVLPALFLVVSAVGLVAPNATALAMAEYPDVAGAASGLVGVLQFLIGGIAAPIVGAFGTRTALPMATTIVALAGLSVIVPIVGLRSPRPVP